ncbi:MAG: metallophosphoesterase [Gammaproteobacteria bacterium]|jgi:Icc protein|nr:metallophosphoesterase [Gammaproteobacteria bacterium]
MTKRIIQLTDLHLQATADTLYKGILPDARLRQCLAWLNQQDYDLLLLTGDLCHAGSLEGYHRLQHYLSALHKPWLWLPGNHDAVDNMLSVCEQSVDSVRSIELAGWQVILLNTTDQPDGRGGGGISQAHLGALAEYLQGRATVPTLIVMHHNPVAVASLWQDKIMLANADQFTRLLAAHKQVQAVVFGHIHQVLDRYQDGIRYLGSPATSIQFAVQQEQFTLQPELGPGLRIIDLSADGDWHTRVVYLDQQDSHYG